MTSYLIAMTIFAGLYALMALGLNIVWGMAGMINLGLVGFFALGGYASALLTVRFGAPIVVGLAAAFVFAAGCGGVRCGRSPRWASTRGRSCASSAIRTAGAWRAGRRSAWCRGPR